MRILRVIATLDPRSGGPAMGARQVDAELVRQGCQVSVVCLDAPGESYHADYPAHVHALGPSRLRRYRYNLHLIPWLKANRGRYQAVIVDGLWQFHSAAARRGLAGSDTPYFVFTHGMLDPWFKHAYPLKHLKKWLYWPWLEYRVLRDARAVIFTCESERLLARESFWLYRCNETVCSLGTMPPPPGADASRARFIARFPELAGKRIVLFLGRIHEKKGCDLLIQAFARVAGEHEDLHLVMAGPDQTGWTQGLKDMARALGIADRITWPGMLLNEGKWGALHAAEVFCLPSHQENFGIAVVESLACATPVLISNQVNIWREIQEHGAGLVDTDTIEGTTALLQRWLSLPEAARNDMKAHARACFDALFDIDRTTSRLLEIIRQDSFCKA